MANQDSRAAVLARLCAAPIALVERVGLAPLDDDDIIEITLATGAVFHVDISLQHATDIVLYEGAAFARLYDHLIGEDPEHHASSLADWRRAPENMPWLIGKRLAAPRRASITRPYRAEVGYTFEADGRTLALFGMDDLLFIADLNDPRIASFALESEARSKQ